VVGASCERCAGPAWATELGDLAREAEIGSEPIGVRARAHLAATSQRQVRLGAIRANTSDRGDVDVVATWLPGGILSVTKIHSRSYRRSCVMVS
jgi:hypothetical protein